MYIVKANEGEMKLLIGEYVRQLRKKAGQSQGDLAEALGVSLHTVFRLENNKLKTSPDSNLLQGIAKYFGIAVDELLNGPRTSGFTVVLKHALNLEGVNEEMSANSITLTVTDDGFVGVSGGKKFESKEDIDNVVEEIRRKLNVGFETREKLKGEG